MTQKQVELIECAHCFALIQYSGQSHSCPEPNVGEANLKPDEAFEELLDEIRRNLVKIVIKNDS